MFLVFFLFLVYVCPVLIAAWVLLTGIAKPAPCVRHVIVAAVPAAALAALAVKVRIADGGTSYADFLRATACVAAAGPLIAVARMAKHRRDRQNSRPRTCP